MTERIVVSVGSEKIIGVFHKSSKGSDACVISCHGLLASKDGPKYLLLADELNKKGYANIRFDFRGCGESGGHLANSNISARLKDLEAVVEYAAQNLGINSFGLFGSSMGGFVSYLKASSDTRINALVSLSAPISMAELFNARNFQSNSYEIDGVVFGSEFLSDVKTRGTLDDELLGAISCPTLIFHGTFDGLVPISHARRLYEKLKSEKMLEIIPGGDHIFSHPMHLFQIVKTSSEWFQKHLKG